MTRRLAADAYFGIIESLEFTLDARYRKWMRLLREPVDDFGDEAQEVQSPSIATCYRAASEITSVLLSVDESERAARWESRYRSSFCPDLFAERWPDRTTAWLESRDDINEEQVVAAETLYADYQHRRETLRRTACDRSVAALMKHYSAIGIEPLQLRFQESCFQLRQLIVDYSRLIESLLNEEQSRDYRNAEKHAWSLQVRLAGPPVSAEARLALTGEVAIAGYKPPYINPTTGRIDQDYGKYDSYEEWKAAVNDTKN